MGGSNCEFQEKVSSFVIFNGNRRLNIETGNLSFMVL